MISHTCSLSYLCSSWKTVSSSPPRLIKRVCKGENFSKRFHLFFCPSLTSEPQQQPLETKPCGVCLAPRKMLSAAYEGAKQRSVTAEEDEEGRVDGWESREVVKRRRWASLANRLQRWCWCLSSSQKWVTLWASAEEDHERKLRRARMHVITPEGGGHVQSLVWVHVSSNTELSTEVWGLSCGSAPHPTA